MSVSILIPVYNSSQFIEETLVSVILQTYEEWECILVDDHSTDDSSDRIQRIIDIYPEKFRLYQNNGKGACAARNLAFSHAKGDFIQYLDADDILSEEKIEVQLRALSENPLSIASCTWGRFYGRISTVKWEAQAIDRDYENPVAWLIDSWMGKGMAQTSVWLTPRKLIELSGPWNESLSVNQDGEFFTRVLMHAQNIKFCEKAKIFYRSGLQDSISQSVKNRRKKAESLLRSYKNYEVVLKKEDNKTIRIALGNNYLNFIYQHYASFPDLSITAADYFYALGHQKMWPVGGIYFKLLAKLIGFNKANSVKKKLLSIFKLIKG